VIKIFKFYITLAMLIKIFNIVFPDLYIYIYIYIFVLKMRFHLTVFYEKTVIFEMLKDLLHFYGI